MPYDPAKVPSLTFESVLNALPIYCVTCTTAAPVRAARSDAIRALVYRRALRYGTATRGGNEPSMKNSLPCFLSLCAAMLFTAALLRAFKERADATPARRMPLTIPTLRCARAATRRASRSHNDITYAAEAEDGF